MKAAILHNYGPPEVIGIEEVPMPKPKRNEILVKIHASTITMGDSELRRFDLAWWVWLPLRLYMGLFKPRKKASILGQEMSGEVVEVGENVENYRIGDRVAGPSDQGFGCHAEYRVFSGSSVLVKLPDSISYEQATTLPAGGINAIYFIDKLDIQQGQTLLINGAGGSIGSFALQLAKHKGAEVTAVDSGEKLEMLRGLGADHVVDYTEESYWKSDAKYDLVFDVWSKKRFRRAVRALKKRGKVLYANPMMSILWLKLFHSLMGTKKITTGIAPYRKEDLQHLTELMRDGKLVTFIDKSFPLDEIVEAHRYVDTGAKKGHIVIHIP